GYAVLGWTKHAEWPFAANFAAGSPAHSLRDSERIPPTHQFAANRLVDLDGDGFPAWMDYLGQAPIAYFRHEPGAGYDPDDCDMEGEASLLYRTPTGEFSSPGPNPYTAGTVDSIDRPL